MTFMNMQEAKTNLSKLVAMAQSGEDVIIGNRGKAAVRLVPIEKQSKRKLGFVEIHDDLPDSFFEPLPDKDLLLWEGENLKI
jgi:prevent-host-death family protein